MTRSRIGPARIGPIETIGFDGPMTITSAAAMASTTASVGRLSPLNRTSRTSGPWRRWTKYSWKSIQPSSIRTCGPDRLVGHRQDPGRDAEGGLERQHRLGQRPALADPCRARDVRREVAIAEPEPVLLAVLGQCLHHGPGLAALPPASIVVEAARQHVQQGVVIGHDEEAMPFRVVAGIDHDGQVAVGEDRLEPVGQFRAAGPAGQGHDLHRVPSPVEELADLGHPVDRLAVVRRRHPDDDGLEAQLGVRPYRVGHLGRGSEQRPALPMSSSPLCASSAPSTRLGLRPARRG